MADSSTDSIVRCHSGYTYAERPTAILWQGEWLTVSAIQKQWRIPGGRKFIVRTQGQQQFELFYGELYDEWRIHKI